MADIDLLIKQFGENIQKRRKALRMNCSAFGRACGVDGQMIRLYEQGTRNPSLYNALKIRQFLSEPLDELIGIDANKL